MIKDVVDVDLIKSYLDEPSAKVCFYDSIASTSDCLKERLEHGEDDVFMVIADNQTKGRGRQGKSFFSPSGSGIYFSFLVRNPKPTAFNYITVITAISLKESIERVFNKPVGIKWVNDIYVGNKKCAGILAEAVRDKIRQNVNGVVIGIGVNVSEPIGGFPKELLDIATSLSIKVENGKNKLIANTVNTFLYYYNNFERFKDDIVARYQSYSVLIGKKVSLSDTGEVYDCVGIDDNCNLVVASADGTRRHLNAGEVSLTLKR